MLNQEQKLQLAEHIVSLNISNSVICGNTDDEDYYSLVERVATGHGIKRKNNNKELCLLSAASKYCGHHNRKYPFYDSVNLKILKSWGYRGCDHDFPTYVKAFRDVQQKNGLGELTLRELDYYLWAKGTKPV